MADIFGTNDVRKLLHNKFVLFLGSSSMRGTYKDLALLTSRNEISSLRGLQRKGELSHEGDNRIAFSGLIKGRQYEEGRKFCKFDVQLEYHFIARCFSPQVQNLFYKIKNNKMKVPDVVVMNSCIWDLSRWGPNGEEAYKENMRKLVTLLEDCLPKETLFIWTTALPVSNEIRGGLLIKQLNFMQNLLRFEVMEANHFCSNLLVSHGYDVLDIHYYLRMQVLRRLKDGLHYNPEANRFITNLILTHIALSWGSPLPGNVSNAPLRRMISGAVEQISDASKETRLDKEEMKKDLKENISKNPSSDVQKTSVLKQAIEDAVCHEFPASNEFSKGEKENQVVKYERPNFKRKGGPLNRWPGDNQDKYCAHVRENFRGPSQNSWRLPNHRRGGPYSKPQEIGRSNYGNFERGAPIQRTSIFQLVSQWSSRSRSCAKKLRYN